MKDGTIKEFLNDLSSSAPTPGGGSASSLVGSIGSSLICMCARLTYSKKGYELVHEEMKKIINRMEEYSNELLDLAEEDQMVFDQLMASFQLEKTTQELKEIRVKKIQDCTYQASLTPLKVASIALEVMKEGVYCANHGNSWAVSDAISGVIMAHAALKSVLLNTKINLVSLNSMKQKQELMQKVNEFEQQALLLENKVLTLLNPKVK